METPLYPLRFKPVYKDYVWGGTRLASHYGRETGGGICAESWEVACLKDGMSVLENGPLAGRTLADLMTEYGPLLMGSGFAGKPFPLLVKLLDARDRLSVQVHPDETTAPLSGGEPKTEAWYILAADPGAGVHAGFKDGVTPSDFELGLKNNTLEALLNWIPVSAGQTIFIPGGRVHAIGSGCLILEVQQTSNTTFRLHDWARVGTDGKPRPLHVDEARKAIRWNFEKTTESSHMKAHSFPGGVVSRLVGCPFFAMEQAAVSVPYKTSGNGQYFEILFVAKGAVRIDGNGSDVVVKTGETVLVPASVSASIQPIDGSADVVMITPRAGKN